MQVYKGTDPILKRVHENLNKIEEMIKTPKQKATEKKRQEDFMKDIFGGFNPFGSNK